ncbi:hypothetical protein [Paenibacillus koleovorans]|uniref:hypothetical protein n=1 Tax=Paenibacillus koleovorans TaxID=121608 RepID=UPI000FDBEE04|nr:hypothetical protein [Paenibacillus koleovorans]
MKHTYELMEIARIGTLFLCGDWVEQAMTPERRAYTSGDDIDFEEHSYNALKRILLLTERIDRSRKEVSCCVWVLRPDKPNYGEPLLAGRTLPAEGHSIIPLGPELARAFAGTPTTRFRPAGEETVYYPLRNSDEDIVAVLEVSEYRDPYFI